MTVQKEESAALQTMPHLSTETQSGLKPSSPLLPLTVCACACCACACAHIHVHTVEESASQCGWHTKLSVATLHPALYLVTLNVSL